MPAGVKEYLAKRGIDRATATSIGIGYWPRLSRIVIPYFDNAGEIIFMALHSHKGVVPKYLYPEGPKPLYIPGRAFEDRVVIVEGQYDAIIAWLAGYKAIAIGGSYLAPHVEQDLLDEIEGFEVSVCLDGDAIVPASKLVQRLLELGVYSKIVILPPTEDPASLGVEKLKELIG